MSHQIDPIILQKLEAFAERRRKLIIIRGVCAAIAMLLAAMLVIAVIDWLVVLPDWLRWTLTHAAYVVILLVEWRACLRLLLRSPGPRELSRLLEKTRPDLHEDVISAVELGDPASDALWDSERFRELLQSSVSGRMRDIDVEKLLPLNLVRSWLRVAVLLAAGIIVMAVFTGLDFGKLAARALFPMINLGRVSVIQVRILRPEPPNQLVPQGDTVAVLIEVTGGEVDEAVLETFGGQAGREKSLLKRTAPNQFAGIIQLRREPLEYRFRAGDAVTRRYTLDAWERPHVVEFQKTYHYPDYARLEARTVAEDNGDLAGLEGSNVELVLKTNQVIREGELRIEAGETPETVPLEREDDQTLRARFPMKRSGTYRVHLVGNETGFENKLSPQYEIRVEPDLAPSVEIDAPEEDLILPASEIVALRGTARDDFGIASVSQFVRINSDEWIEVPLAENAGTETEVSRAWDLFELSVTPGDVVTTRLMATDLRGSSGESRHLKITISSQGFDPSRRQVLRNRQALHGTLQEMRSAAEQVRDATEEARKALEQSQDATEPRQRLAGALSALAAAEQRTAQAQQQLKDLLTDSASGHEPRDLALMGRVLGQTEEALRAGRQSIEEAVADPAADAAGKQAEAAREDFKRAASKAQAMEETYRALLAAQEASVATADLARLSEEEKRLSQFATQKDIPESERLDRLASSQRAAASETEALEEALKPLSQRAGGKEADRVKEIARNLEKKRSELEKAIESDKRASELPSATSEMQKAAEGSRDAMVGVQRELANRARAAREKLEQQAGASHETVEQLRKDVESLAKEEAGQAAQIGERFEAAIRELKTRAGLEELRPASDAAFVNDLTGAVQTLKAMKEDISNPVQNQQDLEQLAKALRTVEAGHDLAEAEDQMQELVAGERWPDAGDRAPQDWDAVEAQMRALPEKLKGANAPEDAAKMVGDALKSEPAKTIDREMDQRLSPKHEAMTVAKPAQELATRLEQAQQAMQEPVRDAREQIAAMAPSLNEIMEDLARTASAVQAQTNEQAHQESPETGPLQSEQEALNAEVADLQDALRRDANTQDILSPEGRERARDADDAVAMLRHPPVAAAEALREAAAAAEAPAKTEALASAAEQQAALADALNQLAEHYANIETGEADATRAVLRDAEEALGIEEQLDGQYARAEQLAELAGSSPEEALAQLEAQLEGDEVMRSELGSIADAAVNEAAATLQAAADREGRIAGQLENFPQEPKAAQPQLADAGQKQTEIAEVVSEAGSDLARAGRHAERLDGLAEALQQAGEQVQQIAKNELPAAQESLAGADTPGQAKPAVEAAQQAMENQLAQLGAAAQEAMAGSQSEPSPGKPGQPAGQPGESGQPAGPSAAAPSPQESVWMARALDSLDAALNAPAPASAAPPGQETPSGQPGQPGEAMAAAQPALSAAAQAQASAMAAARMPGMPMTGGMPAETPGSAASQSEGALSAAGPPATADAGDEGELGEADFAAGGDWGKLPPEMARDLMEGQREGVAGEYRSAVETYFKVIAEQAQERNR